MAGVPAALAAARGLAIDVVPGIEITAVWQDRDVHILGYFLDPSCPPLVAFLEAQHTDRIRRARAVGERLEALGVRIDVEALIAASGARPVSRPAIADALTAGGYTRTRDEAFARFLGEDALAYVPRCGATPEQVIGLIRLAGGLSSLAHPGLTEIDGRIPELARAGLDAIEVYHPEHRAEQTVRYLALARELNLGVTGGSDCHGEDSHYPGGLGSHTLPPEQFDDLCRRARAAMSRRE